LSQKENFTTLEEIIETLKKKQLSPENSYSYVTKIEQKIKIDLDALFEGLAGARIHEIQSKIGYAKNLLSLVIESKGAFNYNQALQSVIVQLEDILALYHKSGVSTRIK